MPDRLVRRLPPMSNEWSLGLASGRALDDVGVARLVAVLEEGEPAALQEQLAVVVAAVETANSNFFRFDIETAVDDDEPAVLRLTPTQDTRAAGLGLDREHSTRKLVAMVVLAVDGDGVQLVVEGQERATDAVPGSIVMFPAYCNVRVVGSEAAAVDVAACHAFGPAFR